MKNPLLFILFAAFALTLPLSSAEEACDSYLASEGLPYDQYTPDFFRKNIQEEIRKAKASFRKLEGSGQPSTFANTIEGIEQFKADLEETWLVLEHYLQILPNQELTEIYNELSPQITKLKNEIFFDIRLFRRVEKLYHKRDSLNLDKAQARLLRNTYMEFLKNGINLERSKQARLTEVKVQLALLGEKFKNNVIAESSKIGLLITDPKNLAGLPKDLVESAAETAKKKGHAQGWAFALNNIDSYTEFLEKSENRELRRQLWTAFQRRATNGPSDNRMVLLKIAKLRQEQAQILGFKNFAELTLKNRMAKNVETVTKFLDRLSGAYRPHALKDIEELEKLAQHKIEPWDVPYYSKKLKKLKFDVDADDLRKYFPFEQMLEAAFYTAERLYKAQFIERKDLPVWHKDVRAFEVLNKNKESVALFYLDPFPRDSKRGGAYSSLLRLSGRMSGKWQIPHVINVLNSPLPKSDKPSLLDVGEARTIFHELGHGLHQILTRIAYPSISGTEVAWDGVELASQLNEKWLVEVLPLFARHHQTGEALPQAMIEKIIASEYFQVAMMELNQLIRGKLDMAWHTMDLSKVNTPEDVEAFEEQVTRDLRVFEKHGQLISGVFSHIFSGGYAAGYYSYRWADCLVACAHAQFKKVGMFNDELAKRYVDELLSQGGIDDFDVLYRNAFGVEPSADDLLRSEGLIP